MAALSLKTALYSEYSGGTDCFLPVSKLRKLSRDAVQNVFPFWALQEILWSVFRGLVLLGPLAHRLKVAARVFGVEIWECSGVVLTVPNLTKQTDVDGAHQLLPQDV